MVKHLLFFLNIFFVSLSVHGLKEIPIRNHYHTTIEISKEALNRFAIKNDRIKELIGGEEALLIESEEETGQVFLKPKNLGANPIPITILTENGLTHDLELIPQDKKGESILFYEATGTQEKGKEFDDASLQKGGRQISLKELRVLSLLKYMVLDQRESNFSLNQKFPSKTTPHKDPLLKPDRVFKVKGEGGILDLTPLAFYKEGSLEGYVLALINKGDEPLFLQEKDMSLPEDLGVMLLQHNIPPQEKTLLFIVKEKGGEGNESSKGVEKRGGD